MNEQPALCPISSKACSGNGTNDHARHESLPTKQHRKNETWSARGAGAAWPIKPDVPAANEDARSAIADYSCASNGSELPDFPGPIQATYNNMGLARDSPFPRKFPCSFTDPFTSLCTSADAPTHDLSIDFMRYDLALRGPTCDKTLKGLDPQVCPNPQGEASLLSCRHPLRAASRGPPVGCVTAADNVMTVSPVSSWHDESCASSVGGVQGAGASSTSDIKASPPALASSSVLPCLAGGMCETQDDVGCLPSYVNWGGLVPRP